MAIATRFRHAGAILIRATTDPGDLDLPDHVDLDDVVSVERDGMAWLTRVWTRPEVREAVRSASTALDARIDHLLADGGRRPGKDLRHAIVSLGSYLARWQRRATPFGLFAGITAASIGPAAAYFGVRHRVFGRADSAWLATVTNQLDKDRDLRSRLTVIADNALIIRDGRAIVHTRADPFAADPGPLRESSVRLTKPVRFALAAATSPIRFGELAERLVKQFPAASSSKVHVLLHGLVDGGLLVTNLRAPATTVDPLSYLVEVLRSADVGDLPEIAALLGELTEIDGELARHNAVPEWSRARTIREMVTARMNQLAPADQVLALNTRLDARVVVPDRVLAEAELAASVLLRTGTQPFGTAAWMDYQARFLARYGPGALVPVCELVAESGLGYPTGYLGAPRARPAWRALTERDAALAALIQQALVSGSEEIVLTDADIDSLTVGDHADLVPPQRVEVGFIIDAVSAEAINRGQFRIRITAAPHVPTSMAGRFVALLGEPDRARFTATYPSSKDGTVAVQLSFPPRLPRSENVVRVPVLLPDVLWLSEHPNIARTGIRRVSLDDLTVTADAAQMYLVQQSTGRRVVPVIPHALNTRSHMPPLARFIAEVADARNAVLRGFDLGSSRTLPYVPSIRYHRTVLLPARWRLTPSDLRGRDFGAALSAWRLRWGVPDRVVLCHDELRMPLDLGHQLDREVLRVQLGRSHRVELHEDGPEGSDGWIGRPAELLIPMTAIDPPTRRLPVTGMPGTVHRPGHCGVVHAQFAGNPARFDEIITSHLPRLADGLSDLVTRWWVRRHRDMIHPETDQHVAVFFRLADPACYGTVAAAIADFAADLATRGLPDHLTLAPHYEHAARYGTGHALEAAENVFATDTTAARTQISAASSSGIPPQAWAAASMALLAASFASDPVTGHRALLDCLPQEHGPLDRAVRDHAVKLASDERVVRALPGGPNVIEAWAARATALSIYHGVLAEQRDPVGVLRTLLHDHHVRAVGIDPTFERETGRLARAAARRCLALMATL
ncbi:MAG TPA: lantibiotic dehydratase [Pseudonocardiaceae bacterium]